MVKQSDEFGALVRQILADQRLALTEVAQRSRRTISYGTVRSMAQQGIVPNPALIVAFAKAVGAEGRVNELLDAAGIWYLRYVEEAPDRVRDRHRGKREVRAAVAIGA